MLTLKQSNETNLWISDAGYFVIEQTDQVGRHSEIFLSLEQANRIALYITDNNEELAELWNQDQGIES